MQEETFELNAEFVRASASRLACEPHIELNQLLKLVGVCDSGGAGKALVADVAHPFYWAPFATIGEGGARRTGQQAAVSVARPTGL